MSFRLPPQAPEFSEGDLPQPEGEVTFFSSLPAGKKQQLPFPWQAFRFPSFFPPLPGLLMLASVLNGAGSYPFLPLQNALPGFLQNRFLGLIG